MVKNDFVRRIIENKKYIVIIEHADIPKLYNLMEYYIELLKYTHPKYIGNSEVYDVDDLLEADFMPREYVIGIVGIEATPQKYTKNLTSLIARRITKEFRTVLPISDLEILGATFEKTPLMRYIKNYGVVLNDYPSELQKPSQS